MSGAEIRIWPVSPIKLMSAREIARAAGIDRHRVSEAMDQWSNSRGRFGLRFVQLGQRRMACAKSVQAWYDALERMAASGY